MMLPMCPCSKELFPAGMRCSNLTCFKHPIWPPDWFLGDNLSPCNTLPDKNVFVYLGPWVTTRSFMLTI